MPWLISTGGEAALDRSVRVAQNVLTANSKTKGDVIEAMLWKPSATFELSLVWFCLENNISIFQYIDFYL